ncbi:hypothetical protein CYMTET_26031 [Cymbomonas tetramitiformis]|uniref:Uncharacterized protein n=1 Tax=Cymbomonas tetramitiformis TaxID=36881 RepID=A0AAE0FSJ9_9CHLO|nr:hypothetical protein CYMTET_26031 [Cymbomonas tetramitiformis]|eukprot:gene11190-13225_t
MASGASSSSVASVGVATSARATAPSILHDDEFALQELVLPRLSLAGDVLRFSMTCRSHRAFVEGEAFASGWLRSARHGADPDPLTACVGSRWWVAQLRRRAILESPTCALPMTLRFKGSFGRDGYHRKVSLIQGVAAAGSDQGSVTLWNPYRSYQWMTGRDHRVGCLGSGGMHGGEGRVRGDVSSMVTLGDRHLLVGSEEGHLVVSKTDLAAVEDEGECGQVCSRMQKEWPGRRALGRRGGDFGGFGGGFMGMESSDEEEEEVEAAGEDGDGLPELPMRAGPGRCAAVCAIQPEAGAPALIVGMFYGAELRVWRQAPEFGSAEGEARLQEAQRRVRARLGLTMDEAGRDMGSGSNFFQFMTAMLEVGSDPYSGATLLLTWALPSRPLACAALGGAHLVVGTVECAVLRLRWAVATKENAGTAAIEVVETLELSWVQSRKSLGMCIAVEGALLAVGTWEHPGIDLWELDTLDLNKPARLRCHVTLPETSLSLRITDGLVLVGEEGGQVSVVDGISGQMLRTLEGVGFPGSGGFGERFLSDFCIGSRYLVAVVNDSRAPYVGFLDLFHGGRIGVDSDGCAAMDVAAQQGGAAQKAARVNAQRKPKCPVRRGSDDEGDGIEDSEEDGSEEEEDTDEEDGASVESEVDDGSDWESGSEPSCGEESVEVGVETLEAEEQSGKRLLTSRDFRTVQQEDVEEAEYMDQSLACVALDDGRELVVASEAWEVTLQGDARRLAEMPVKEVDRFVALGNGGLLLGAKKTELMLLEASSAELLLSQPLPGVETLPKGESVMVLTAAPGQPQAIAVTQHFVFLVTVGPAASCEASRTHDMQVVLQLDFRAHAVDFPVAQNCYSWARVLDAVLWYDEMAASLVMVLPSEGRWARLHFFRLSGVDGEVSQQAYRVVRAHRRRTCEKTGSVLGMAVWQSSEGGTHDKLVTAGDDGRLAVTELSGEGTEPLRSWRATSTNRTPCRNLAVHSASGVAFTTSTPGDNCGYFWDLESGERVKKVAPMGRSLRDHRFTVMCTAFTASGILAYTNSNDCDEAVLSLLVPKQLSAT